MIKIDAETRLSIKASYRDGELALTCQYYYFPLASKLSLDSCIVMDKEGFNKDVQKILEDIVEHTAYRTIFFTYATAIDNVKEHFKTILDEFIKQYMVYKQNRDIMNR